MVSLSFLRPMSTHCLCRRISSKRPWLLLRSCNSIRHHSATMKVVCIDTFGSAGVLKLRDIPVPTPQNSEVLVKVHAAGINPVDTYIREGEFMVLPELPVILGKEASGIIEGVGRDVKGLKVGDRVVCCLPWNGGYAEYVTCDEKYAFPLPQKLSFSQGAALYVAYFTAYRALVTMGNIRKGESLLVHGASGAVGIAAVQIAKAKGLSVVGSASSDEGKEIVKSVGADYIINHKERESGIELYSTTSSGFDIILETCAHINLDKDLLLLNQKGRVAIVGSRGPVEINPRSLIYTEGKIFGVKLIGITQDEFKESVVAITRGIEEGWINPIIAKEYNMKFATKAHEELMSNTGARGKIVFVM